VLKQGWKASFLGLALAALALSAAAPASAATINVTSTNDSGAGSLRQAIAEAAPGDTISLPASTGHYAITSASLTIDKSLTITGAGARGTVIDGMHEAGRVLEVTAGTVAISGVTVTGGAEGGVRLGGGASLTLSNVSVSGNGREGSDDDGGGIEAGSGAGTKLTVDASTIADNLAYNGGGIWNEAPEAVITDSTIAGNHAGGLGFNGEGGGILANEAVELVNDTLAGNECFVAAGCGGGIEGKATVKNTIVAENLSANEKDEEVGPGNCAAEITDTGPNLESGSECKFAEHGGISDANPMLTQLADNGGPTETMALEPGSPAIDHGTNEGCPQTDQRGAPRPQPPGGTCDIGAVEFGALADLAVSQQASPSPVNVGLTLTYTLTISNDGPGPDAAGATTLVDTLPAGASLLSSTPSQGSCSGTASVTCSLGSLASGASARVTIAVRPTSTGTVTNSATVSSAATDPNLANNSSQLQTVVQPLILCACAAMPQTPSITDLRESARTWREGDAPAVTSAAGRHAPKPPVGTTFSFMLAKPATVTFKFTMPAAGRRVRGRCVAPSRHNGRGRRCTRTVIAGTLTFAAREGLNSVHFDGVVSRRLKLRPGSYTLIATATAAGGRSRPATVRFTIVRR
jgi:uncharacterized repeat protein (TIGR01451 family)